MKFIAQMEPWIGKEEKEAVDSVLASGWITEASKTREFESRIASFVKSKYASVLSNGTVTLFAGLKVLGVGPGDEVIVPDFTMVASPNTVVMVGAKPVFVDIKKENLCLDLTEVEKKITKKTKAIMPVAINGRAPDMDSLMKLAKKYKLFVLEDAAQAFGSYYKGKHLGTIGDIGSFSFSTPKVITTGQGGALVTDNKEFSDKIIRIKDFGRIDRNTQNHDEIGYNFKFTDIQAALGLAQMGKLEWRLKRKKEMYKLYKDCLKEVSQVKFIKTDLEQTSPWFIDIMVEDPIKLSKYLKTKNIGTRVFYPAIHTTKPYKGAEKFPNSLWASTHGLWLPSSTFLTESDIILICSAVKEFYEKN
ncbi:MAG: DegT/DnrJ/EryC1/StrS family aminotransferase [Candidatus Levybacteria bacterium]|nr:DegT/DnrJ/EryC1/StrS family aminotransferase [Candidatus Levybacteria bacterium]